MLQNILASRKNEGGWMQLLPLVVLALFYAVGAILKAKNAQSDTKPVKDEKLEGAFKDQAENNPRPQPRQMRRPEFTEPAFTNLNADNSSGVQQSLSLASPETVADVPLDFAPGETDPLRRAIIHFEIFSKPIALRD